MNVIDKINKSESSKSLPSYSILQRMYDREQKWEMKIDPDRI